MPETGRRLSLSTTKFTSPARLTRHMPSWRTRPGRSTNSSLIQTSTSADLDWSGFRWIHFTLGRNCGKTNFKTVKYVSYDHQRDWGKMVLFSGGLNCQVWFNAECTAWDWNCVSLVFRWFLLSGGRKDRFDCTWVSKIYDKIVVNENVQFYIGSIPHSVKKKKKHRTTSKNVWLSKPLHLQLEFGNNYIFPSRGFIHELKCVFIRQV